MLRIESVYEKVTDVLTRVVKSPTFWTLGVFTGASMISSALSGLGGVIQARWISPEVLGQFQKYGILTSYLAILVVVVQDGLSRQYPYLVGKGDGEEALRVVAAAKTWYVIVTVFAMLLFGVLSLASLCQKDYIGTVGWGVQIIVALCTLFGAYIQTVYRRSLEFKRLSYNGLISSCLGFLSLVFVKFLGFYGLAIKTSIMWIVRFALDAKYIPIKVQMKWDVKRLFELAKIALPLSMEGYIRTSFMTATFGYLVLKFCGAKELGLYGVALAFEGFAALFLNSLMQIFDVKMAYKFGETESIMRSARSLVVPVVLGIACSLAIGIAFCIAIGPFINYFLPKYVEAIPIAYILAIELPLGVMAIPVRLLRVALRYKSIYLISITRVLVVVVGVCLAPKTLAWMTGCRMLAEFVFVFLGMAILLLAIKRERYVALAEKIDVLQ